MGKIRQEIDFEIIWKKIYRISTEEEDRILNHWLQEKRMNREFFAKAEKYYQQDETPDLPIDIEKSLRRFWLQINRTKLVWKRIASIAAVVVLVFTASYFHLSIKKQEPKIVSDVALAPIKPGKNEAVLILNNGLSYELTPKKNISLDLHGVQVNSKGKALEYVANNREVKKTEYNMLKVPRGGEFFLILSDSTKVWLNSGTTLRYPVQFSGNERRVELEGEAYFQVRKEKRPFRVQSQGQVVEVLGTQFNVSAYPEEGVVLTTLVAGEIKVFLAEEPETAEILLPGTQSCFVTDKQVLTQYPVDVNEFAAWKDGWFVFNNATLESMMKTLSRWYNVNVIFENDKSRSIRFTGEIKRYDNLNKFLSFIEKTNEVKMAIDGQTVTIK